MPGSKVPAQMQIPRMNPSMLCQFLPSIFMSLRLLRVTMRNTINANGSSIVENVSAEPMIDCSISMTLRWPIATITR